MDRLTAGRQFIRLPSDRRRGEYFALLTLVYDVATNAGAFVVISGEKTAANLVKFIGAGIVFMTLHLVWNTLVFTVVLTPVLIVLGRYRRELSGE